MKKLIINLSLSFMLTSKLCADQLINHFLFITYPENIEVIGYHMGYRIPLENNTFTLPETKPCNRFILFVTPEVTAKIDGHNVKYLERDINAPVRLFYFTKSNSKDKAYWIIEEENKNNIPVRLPEDSIVVLLDPSFIENITCREQSAYNSSEIVILPEIKLKKKLDLKKLKDITTKALLGSLDTTAAHVSSKRLIASQKNLEDNCTVQTLRQC